MILKKLFGEDIDISQENFGKAAEKILLSAKEKKLGLNTSDKTALSAVTTYMQSYKDMLEKRNIDVLELRNILCSIIDTSIRAYVVYIGGSIDDMYDTLLSTLIKKNKDYGNASVKNGGSVGNYVRMSDKLSRITNLLGKEGAPNFESIGDTWLDLAGYATIGTIILNLTATVCGEFDKKTSAQENPFGYEEGKD